MADPAGEWRVGSHYGIHVYEGDRPVATFLDPADAERAVAAVNAQRTDAGLRAAAERVVEVWGDPAGPEKVVDLVTAVADLRGALRGRRA